jgi:hypothetical protein
MNIGLDLLSIQDERFYIIHRSLRIAGILWIIHEFLKSRDFSFQIQLTVDSRYMSQACRCDSSDDPVIISNKVKTAILNPTPILVSVQCKTNQRLANRICISGRPDMLKFYPVHPFGLVIFHYRSFP